MYLPCLLCFNVPFYRFGWYISCGKRKIAASPQTWHFGKLRELFPQLMRSCSFHSLCNHVWTDSRRHINKKVAMVFIALKGNNIISVLKADLTHKLFETGFHAIYQEKSSSDSADKTPNDNWPLKQFYLFVYIPCVCVITQNVHKSKFYIKICLTHG